MDDAVLYSKHPYVKNIISTRNTTVAVPFYTLPSSTNCTSGSAIIINKSTVSWDVTLDRPAEFSVECMPPSSMLKNKPNKQIPLLSPCLVYCSTLKMEAVQSSETSVNIKNLWGNRRWCSSDTLVNT